ncbi:MAG: hypothetical protein CMO55_04655 [Verrucomicrobiales bacterium]|nr:hypothetical protein [Verrucomicrobiales bacterium]
MGLRLRSWYLTDGERFLQFNGGNPFFIRMGNSDEKIQAVYLESIQEAERNIDTLAVTFYRKDVRINGESVDKNEFKEILVRYYDATKIAQDDPMFRISMEPEITPKQIHGYFEVMNQFGPPKIKYTRKFEIPEH